MKKSNDGKLKPIYQKGTLTYILYTTNVCIKLRKYKIVYTLLLSNTLTSLTMAIQVIFSGKHLLTYITFKRFFICMYYAMSA